MPAPHHPGQPPWPDHGGRPDASGDTAPIRSRPPAGAAPLSFHTEAPSPPTNPFVSWGLRILGLILVAVVSGLVWWYIHADSRPAGDAAQPTQNSTAGQFEFTPAVDPRRDPSCAEHAYNQVKTFFQQTPCQQLTRALYTTLTRDGRKVYTNVSVVRMPTADDAARLRALADKDNTGNVNDLIREGLVKVPPLKSLSNGGGYQAVQHEQNVIIVESDYDPAVKKGDKKQDEAALDTICEDAIRLGDQIGA